MGSALDTFDAVLRRVRPLAQQIERVAPLIGASRPLALATSVVGIMADLRHVDDVRPARPVCLEGGSPALDAICRAAADAGVGRVVAQSSSGHPIRQHEGCEWGCADYWRHGPFGDPTVLPRVVWESLGPAIAVTPLGHGARVTLQCDVLQTALPSALGQQVAAEATALRAAGEPVGVLLHGPPGTGKSVIARWVAGQLGGFSLRARLDDVGPSTLLDLARLLAPRAVILDDVDRGETRHALDLAEHLTSSGVALLVTANDTEQLDPALLRARRLGLHYRAEGVEQAVLDELLAGLEVPPCARALLARATVALARDYVGHFRALGPARALELLCARTGGEGERP